MKITDTNVPFQTNESDSKKGKTGSDIASHTGGLDEGAVGGQDTSSVHNDKADVISFAHGSPLTPSQDIEIPPGQFRGLPSSLVIDWVGF